MGRSRGGPDRPASPALDAWHEGSSLGGSGGIRTGGLPLVRRGCPRRWIDRHPTTHDRKEGVGLLRRRIVFSVAALIAVLATPGCQESPTTPPEFEPGPLGAVTLEAGEAVRIRMLLSVTVAPASPVISAAGLVMISPSNASPRLTSDLAGNANPDYHAGYFRVSSNDLHRARALSDFVYHQLELRSVATVHDGDPYTSALVAAFADVFSARGGKVPAQAEIEKGDTDMREVLEQFAAAGPDAIFFPLFITEGSAFAAQARAFDGLEGTTLISAAALLVSAFLETPPSEGIYFAGPESDFRSNVNEVTGRSGKQVLAAFETRHGGFPGSPYWAHTYDATTILLSAIEAVAVEDGDRLHLDRTALRKQVGATAMSGLVGTLSCDRFGDCGTGRINIYHHTDRSVTDVSKLPVVYAYSP